MHPQTLASALLVLIVSVVLSIGALFLIVRAGTYRERRHRMLMRGCAVILLVIIAGYWIGSGLFSSGCC